MDHPRLISKSGFYFRRRNSFVDSGKSLGGETLVEKGALLRKENLVRKETLVTNGRSLALNSTRDSLIEKETLILKRDSSIRESY